MPGFAQLLPGDPAPYFFQATSANPRFAFHTAAGRYLVLCFYESGAKPETQAAVAAVRARPDLFNDHMVSFFGISCDPEDQATGRIQDTYPGYRHFWDFDRQVSRLYGAAASALEPGEEDAPYRPLWLVLDPTLRVMLVAPFGADASGAAAVLAFLDRLPPPARFAGFELQAPIAFLPQVFEPEFCRRLIDHYLAEGGEESGFMREVDGKTVKIADPGHKRRRDCTITDQALRQAAVARIQRRIVPELVKTHQFQATRIERYIVGCYSAEDRGHFMPHRDNTTKGTAHRRFAVTINLNSDFDGGNLSFPEYGPKQFKPPPGGAVVFSCSLLHTVSPVTRGERYVFVPFLYDDAAAALREANNQYLSEEVGAYEAPTHRG